MWGAGRRWHGISRAGEGRAARRACQQALPLAEPLHRLRFWGHFREFGGQTAFPGGRACRLPPGIRWTFGEVAVPGLGKQLGSHGHLGSFKPSPGWGQGCSCSAFPAWVGPRGPKDARAAVPSLVLCNRTAGRLRLPLAGGCPCLIKPSPG